MIVDYKCEWCYTKLTQVTKETETELNEYQVMGWCSKCGRRMWSDIIKRRIEK